MIRPSEALVGQCIVDERQIIVEVSDHFLNMVRFDRSALIGRHALSFTCGADLTRNVPMLDAIIRAGPDFAITKRYVRDDGEIIWVQNQVSAHRDSVGHRYFCATSQEARENIRNEALAQRYDAVRSICSLIVTGRAALGPDIVSLPATEALLLLYKAEIEGFSLTIDELANRTAVPTSVMLRWVAHMHKRELIQIEDDAYLNEYTNIRISQNCEVALDGLLTDV